MRIGLWAASRANRAPARSMGRNARSAGARRSSSDPCIRFRVPARPFTEQLFGALRAPDLVLLDPALMECLPRRDTAAEAVKYDFFGMGSSRVRPRARRSKFCVERPPVWPTKRAE